MRKYTILLIILLMIVPPLIGQDFPEREHLLAAIFPVGKGDGHIGYRPVMNSSARQFPAAFCFDKDEYLYVCDSINKRFCIFDKDYNYSRSIAPSAIGEAGRLEIEDSSGNIIGYNSYALQKMDSEGKSLIKVWLLGETILDRIDSDKGFFIDGNLVFAYKENGGLIGFKDPGPDYKENNRNLMDTDEVVREIQQNHPSLSVEKQVAVTKESSASRSRVPQRAARSEGYQVYQNGELLGRDFNTFLEVTDSKVARLSKSDSASNPYYAYLEKYPRASKYLYGTDDDGNSLWQIGILFMLFDPSGTPIAAIKIDLEKKTAGPVVSPSGDIYYMNSDKTGHYLYKIERDW